MKFKTIPLTNHEVFSAVKNKEPVYFVDENNQWRLATFIRKGVTNDLASENRFWICYVFEISDRVYTTKEVLADKKKILSKEDFETFRRLAEERQ